MTEIYENFQKLGWIEFREVEDRLDDREFLEGLIYSGNGIVFLSQDEIIKFIEKLKSVGLDDVALSYMDKLEEQIDGIEMSEIYRKVLDGVTTI